MREKLICHVSPEVSEAVRREARKEDRKISAVVERALRGYFSKRNA